MTVVESAAVAQGEASRVLCRPLCGLRLSAEGSVVVLPVFDWGEPGEGPVQASVVVPVDPAGSDVLDVGEGLVKAVVEDGRGDRLGLEQSDDRFHQGVGVGIAHGADRGSDALQCEVLMNRMDVYWLPASGVVQQLTRLERDPFAGPGPTTRSAVVSG